MGQGDTMDYNDNIRLTNETNSFMLHNDLPMFLIAV